MNTRLWYLGAVQLILFALTLLSLFQFIFSSSWLHAFIWFPPTLLFFINCWTLGLSKHLKMAFTLFFSGLLLSHLYHEEITLWKIITALLVCVFSVVLLNSNYVADGLWSVKTILLDWVLCMTLMLVCACVDLTHQTKYISLLVGYFCAANIFGVGIMKCCEYLWNWKASLYPNLPHPVLHYVHNLKASLLIVQSMDIGPLVFCCWVILYLLIKKPTEIVDSGYGNDDFANWHVSFVVGLWSTLLVYLGPIASQPLQSPPREQS